MKTKSASETADIGGNHAHLGHFRREGVLSKGYEDTPLKKDPKFESTRGMYSTFRHKRPGER